MAQAAAKHGHMGHGNHGHGNVGHGLNKQFAANDPRYDQGHGDHHHHHKKKWWSIDKLAKGGLKLAFMAASFAIGGYVGSLLFDPLFFTPVHDPNNVAARMVEEFMLDHFGWVHDFFGLTGGNGVLQSDFVLNDLGMAQYIEETPNQIAESLKEGISNEDVVNVQNMSDEELFGPD